MTKKNKVPVKKKSAAKRQAGVRKSVPDASSTVTPLATLREEIDNLFDRFSEQWPNLPNIFGKGWSYPMAEFERRFGDAKLQLTPRVDVTENESQYDIVVELPGMNNDDIEVAINDDSLTVKGEKRDEAEKKDKNYHIRECSYGAFQRTFRIPGGVENDNIEASFSNGILNIKMPKSEKAKENTRTIPVK